MDARREYRHYFRIPGRTRGTSHTGPVIITPAKKQAGARRGWVKRGVHSVKKVCTILQSADFILTLCSRALSALSIHLRLKS